MSDTCPECQATLDGAGTCPFCTDHETDAEPTATPRPLRSRGTGTVRWDTRGRATMRACPFCEQSWPQRVECADHWPQCPALRRVHHLDAVDHSAPETGV
jgi:hypothetical protein